MGTMHARRDTRQQRHLELLRVRELVILVIRGELLHKLVLHIKDNLATISEIPDKVVERVTQGDP